MKVNFKKTGVEVEANAEGPVENDIDTHEKD